MSGMWLGMEGYSYYDLTVPLRVGIPQWPDSPPLSLERITDVADGDPFTMTALRLDSHTGTHIDAPRHFLADGDCLDSMPMDAVVGPARVIGIESPGSLVSWEDLEPYKPTRGDRILLKTGNSNSRWWEKPWNEEYVSLSLDAARLLAGTGIHCVGIDYLSIAAADDTAADIHRILLGAGVWIIEGLNLSGIDPGTYELMCLPLLVAGCDGAPSRVVLRRALY